MRLKTFLLGLSLVLFPALGAQAQNQQLPYEVEMEQWYQGRLGSLTNPDGYLSLVGLHWLNDKPQTFAGIGTAYLEGQDVVLRLEPGVTVDGKALPEARVTPDQPRGVPDFHQGSSHFFVIRHGKKIGLRVKDPNAPTLRGFAGVERFPLDPAWRIQARFEADHQTIPVASVVDESTDEVSPGYAVFERGGKTYKLRLMGQESDDSYFLVFSDATAGKTTYSGMRFLDVEKAGDGSLLLDFNKAENPPCSMTPFATCPLPPRGNVLPFDVTAGEKTPRGASH
jgi:uncharacterized protein (DUF1684 family)